MQIKILERYGDVITLGEIRKWERPCKAIRGGKVAWSLSDWVAVTNLVVAVVALVVSGVAMYIALRTMNDAEEDWKQRKWYDLYFAAAQPYNLLDQFRKVYPRNVGTLEKNRAWNDAMMSLRQSHALATAFPKTDVIDAFFSASDFSNPDYAFDDERMRKFRATLSKDCVKRLC